MDKAWDYKDWEPSVGFEIQNWPHEAIILSKKKVKSLQAELILLTKSIKDSPYNHTCWTDRAKCLNSLGYPELAAADAYKAHSLIADALNWKSDLGKVVRATCCRLISSDLKILGRKVADSSELRDKLIASLLEARKINYRVLITSLLSLDALPDLFKICKEATDLYPPTDDIAKELHTVNARCHELFVSRLDQYKENETPWIVQKNNLLFGRYKPKVYPWLPYEYRTRSKDVISVANSELKLSSNCLEIRASSIREGGQPYFGMFATRDIREGEPVLQEKHPLAAIIDPSDRCSNCLADIKNLPSPAHFACCPQSKYCSVKCKKVASANYHNVSCKADFSTINARAQKAFGGRDEQPVFGAWVEPGRWDERIEEGYRPDSVDTFHPDQMGILMARVLAICVQHGGDPLKNPKIIALSPAADSETCAQFCLNGNVASMIEILKELGVNVYEEDRYESWVLQTIWSRISSNISSVGGIDIPNYNVSPLLSWFNHSCNPNAASGASKRSCSDTELEATRNIKTGEEVFISYIGEELLKAGKARRQEVLRGWLDCDCECRRCKREIDPSP